MCLRKTKKQLPGRLIARYHPDEELLNIIIDALPPISQTFGLVIMGREIQPT
uniref:Uncharacterized protein n=1 Tax=Physcomitrium patens TaxID=3218 RepID=A0A7I4ER65_PHYPA